MSDSSANRVNGQVTDSVTQSTLQVLGDASAQALAMTYQTMAHSVALSMQNAVSSQNGMQQIAASSVAAACAKIIAAAERS